MGLDGKRAVERNFNMVGLYAINMTENMEKRYAAHKIRETRKASIKQLPNKLHTIGPIELDEYLLI